MMCLTERRRGRKKSAPEQDSAHYEEGAVNALTGIACFLGTYQSRDGGQQDRLNRECGLELTTEKYSYGIEVRREESTKNGDP
jgi:hypothetical protein